MKIQPTDSENKSTPGILTGREKARLGVMVVLLIGVGIALWISILQQRRALDAEVDVAEFETPAPTIVRIAVPDIDSELLAQTVRDDTPSARAVVEPEALQSLYDSARRFAPEHFETPETIELTQAASASLVERAAQSRGDRFTARGWVRSWRERGGAQTGEPHRFECELELEDQTTVYAICASPPEGSVFLDDTYLRIDGLFLKIHRRERDGVWREGPLLVGPRAVRSFRSLGEVTHLDTLALLSNITDDSIGGIQGIPFHESWHLMAYARDVPTESLNWEEAPELSKELISRIAENGAEFRGAPMRVPISVLMGLTVLKAPENPARVEKYTQGWIANQEWKRPFQFRAPFPINLERKELLTARGFFLKNLAYESKDKGLQVAPVFVLHSVEHYIAPTNDTIKHLSWIVALIVVGLTTLIFLLLVRDSRRSTELQAALTERRRARRARAQQA